MASKKKIVKGDYAMVRVAVHVHGWVSDFAERKGYTIGGFFEQAALEKLGREKKKASTQ
jgi:hypothetical protein